MARRPWRCSDVDEFWQIGQELVGARMAEILADQIQVLVSEERPHVAFDEEAQEVHAVVLPHAAAARPFLLAHEFGHVWHCHRHPRESTEHQDRGEVAALYSEGALVVRRPDLWPQWQGRVEILRAWRYGPEAERAAPLLETAFRAGRTNGSYRSVVRRIMLGKFDG